jgi:hypothetical protein
MLILTKSLKFNIFCKFKFQKRKSKKSILHLQDDFFNYNINFIFLKNNFSNKPFSVFKKCSNY